MKLNTKLIKKGTKESDPIFGSVIPPIYNSSTFIFPNADEGALRFSGKKRGMIYSRFTNPTVDALQQKLAALEGGEMAIATSSGMAAIFLTISHLCSQGDEIISHKVIYGGTYELFNNILPKFGIKTHFVDLNNLSSVKKFINKKTKLIYFESPTNPLLEVLDIKKIAKFAKDHNLYTVFDNTFAPPPAQEPLKLGIDVVIHSLTKYIGGHSDLIGGAVIGEKKILEPMFYQTFIFTGQTLSPFSAYLALRGLLTLPLRLKKTSENAQKIAEFLQNQPKIKAVYYPGLKNSKTYSLAKKQMKYFGAVLSFEVKGYEEGKRLVNNLKIINLAVSLGGVESLIEHPASMTHSELNKKERERSGIKEGLIRLSVGLEDPEDLIADLKQALEKI